MNHQYSLGYQTSPAGDQKVAWKEFSYNLETRVNSGQQGTSLEPFSDPQLGRLSSQALAIYEDVADPWACADLCEEITCKSFDFDYFTLECLLHQKVATKLNPLRQSRKFQYWQRLGEFQSWWFEFLDLEDVSHLLPTSNLFAYKSKLLFVVGVFLVFFFVVVVVKWYGLQNNARVCNIKRHGVH